MNIYTDCKITYISSDIFLSAINVIRYDCGELCNTTRTGTRGPYFDHITARVDCRRLFENEFIDLDHGLRYAPATIPKELWDDFTMNNRINVTSYYFDDHFVGKQGQTPVWSEQMVSNYLSQARQSQLYGPYGISDTNALRDGLLHAAGVKNGRVLIIGSITPWVEACVLEAGARQIVTVEYSKIESYHTQIQTLTPNEFREHFLKGKLGLFDAVVTFSSVEHSGLGRYGDGLNPWGDMITIARGWCVTKKRGSLTIGVMYKDNSDLLMFNAHRIYGRIRYPYLTTNWKQMYRGRGDQRIHVFVK